MRFRNVSDKTIDNNMNVAMTFQKYAGHPGSQPGTKQAKDDLKI